MSEYRVTNASQPRPPWADLVNVSPRTVHTAARTLGREEAKSYKPKSGDGLVAVTQQGVWWGHTKAGQGGESKVFFAVYYPFNGGECLEKVVKVSRYSFGGQIDCLEGLSPDSKQSPFIDQIEKRYYMGNMQMIVVQKMDRDLAHARWRADKRPGTRLINWLQDSLHGLASLHRGGMVHRDFKGSNVVVNDDGGAMITDLGISQKLKLKKHLTQGTPGFLAPYSFDDLAAQLKRKGIQGKPADIWAVGQTIQRTIRRLLTQHGVNTDEIVPRRKKFSFDDKTALDQIRKLHEEYGERVATTPYDEHYLSVIHPDRDEALRKSIAAINRLPKKIDLSEKELLISLARLARDLQAPTRQELCQVLKVHLKNRNQADLLVRKVLNRLDRIGQDHIPLEENESPNTNRTTARVRKRDDEDDREIDTQAPTVIVPDTQGAKKRLRFER